MVFGFSGLNSPLSSLISSQVRHRRSAISSVCNNSAISVVRHDDTALSRISLRDKQFVLHPQLFVEALTERRQECAAVAATLLRTSLTLGVFSGR